MNDVNTKSGPHPSLQSESGEIREVQFVVERACPLNPLSEKFTAEAAPYLPRVVWVEWPPVEAEEHTPVFRLTQHSVAEWENFFDEVAPHLNSTCSRVCLHMGRLIE